MEGRNLIYRGAAPYPAGGDNLPRTPMIGVAPYMGVQGNHSPAGGLGARSPQISNRPFMTAMLLTFSAGRVKCSPTSVQTTACERPCHTVGSQDGWISSFCELMSWRGLVCCRPPLPRAAASSSFRAPRPEFSGPIPTCCRAGAFLRPDAFFPHTPCW